MTCYKRIKTDYDEQLMRVLNTNDLLKMHFIHKIDISY